MPHWLTCTRRPPFSVLCHVLLQVIERREDFDFTRHAAFCAFGFAYLGGFQYWLYNIKFTQVGGVLAAGCCAVCGVRCARACAIPRRHVLGGGSAAFAGAGGEAGSSWQTADKQSL